MTTFHSRRDYLPSNSWKGSDCYVKRYTGWINSLLQHQSSMFEEVSSRNDVKQGSWAKVRLTRSRLGRERQVLVWKVSDNVYLVKAMIDEKVYALMDSNCLPDAHYDLAAAIVSGNMPLTICVYPGHKDD